VHAYVRFWSKAVRPRTARNVRFWPIADIATAAHMSAFGGKADGPFCGANVRFLTLSGH
jgi:hypothetical protein